MTFNQCALQRQKRPENAAMRVSGDIFLRGVTSPHRPTLTIPQMIDRNNREVRRRRLTGTLDSLTVASIYVFAMFCTALTLAIAIAERIYPWSL